MKKIVLVLTIFLGVAVGLYADLHSDLMDLWKAYSLAIDHFSSGMDAAADSKAAGKVFDQFVQDLKPAKDKAVEITKTYPHGQGAQYESAYAQEWGSLRASDTQRFSKFSTAMQKLAQFAQSDPALQASMKTSAKDLGSFR